jgi:hypothetical protein
LAESLKFIGLGDIPCRLSPKSVLNILRRRGSRQNNRRDCLQAVIAFEFRKQFAAIHPRHIQVEEDHVWPRLVLVRRFLPQKVRGIDAVSCHVQLESNLNAPECVSRELCILFPIFNEEDFKRPRCCGFGLHVSSPLMPYGSMPNAI